VDFKMHIQNKKIAVVGGGLSGIAAAKLISKKGGEVVLLEREKGNIDSKIRSQLCSIGVEIIEGEHKKQDFIGVDLVVLSPGVPVYKIKPYLEDGILVISELELGFWFIEKEKVIAVTGTNGKTTTVGLISWVLKKLGIDHFVGGNFGIPLCEYILNKRKEIVLLEVSSFQLQNVIHFKPHIGVLLNFSPNHLDYHKSMNEYLKCKMNLFKNQDRSDIAIINKSLQKKISEFSFRSEIKFFSKTNIKTDSLFGEHNQENIAAANIVCRELDIEDREFERAIEDFTPFPHRIEFVAEIDGVKFYNDSKSTTLDSLKAALKAFSGNILLIAGGILKAGDPGDIVHEIKKKVLVAAVFGQSADVFFKAWKNFIPVYIEKDLKDATRRLYSIAKKGDIILLSPGCSSFDMFSNYKERGNYFKKLVCEIR